MSVYSDFASFRKDHAHCVATIGKYDGLHRGHQHVLETLCHEARSRGMPAVVILSEPHPDEFFAGNDAVPRLSPFQEKVDYLLAHGVDAVFKMNFDEALCNLSATSFVTEYLVNGLQVKALIVGDDFRFGKNRTGDFDMLVTLGNELDIDVIREAPCILDGQRVSSTLIREYLRQGDCEMANALLGRCFSLSGLVVPGKKLGRELGFPTANIALMTNKLPLMGIFSVLVSLGNRQLEGVASIGLNPTVENIDIPKLEVFLFDFDEDIYGQTLVVSFIKKLRDEVRFATLDDLKRQMTLDIAQAKSVLAELRGHESGS